MCWTSRRTTNGKKRYKPEEIVPLTPQQVKAFADAVPARCRAMIVAQAGLGLRLSEVLGLRAVDIRFLERVVKIEVQRDRHTMKLVAPLVGDAGCPGPHPAWRDR